MKSITLLFLILNVVGFAHNDQGTPSKIEDVTVYLSGAQITRSASIKVPEGTTEVLLDQLSPYIQESSIQISGLKHVSILSINYGINYLSKQPKTSEIANIQSQIELLNDQIQNEDHIISGFQEELYLITQNRNLGNSNEVVDLEKLQKFANYYRQRTTEIKGKIHEATKQKQSYAKTISELQQQLTELNVDDKVQTGEIKIKLNNDVATSLNLQITYNVSNAGWFPIYDIKAESVDAPIQLNYKAHVYQQTGADWNQIKLTLSTGDPNTNNVKPDINPHYLNFINNYSNYKQSSATRSYNYKYNPLVKTVSGVVTSMTDGLPLPGVSVIEKGTTNGTQTDFDGRYSLQTTGSKQLVFSYVGSKTEELPIHASIMNVALQEDLASLEEVVVVAYGSRASKSKTPGYNNSVQNMINEDFDETPYTEPETYTSNGDVIDEGITNTRFEISKTYSVPSDGDMTVIEIEEYSVPATYAYFAAPVLNENVFLTTKIKNWEQYNLLPAEANVYFEGSYSGKTTINPHSTDEELTISLGVDPNVVVKRTQPKDFKKTTFIGNNRVISKHYEIAIKNNKSAAIDLVLYDRIPISQERDIKIDDIDTGSSEYDDKKGLLKWTMQLKPKASETQTFSYVVKYPKYKRVNL